MSHEVRWMWASHATRHSAEAGAVLGRGVSAWILPRSQRSAGRGGGTRRLRPRPGRRWSPRETGPRPADRSPGARRWGRVQSPDRRAEPSRWLKVAAPDRGYEGTPPMGWATVGLAAFGQGRGRARWTGGAWKLACALVSASSAICVLVRSARFKGAEPSAAQAATACAPGAGVTDTPGPPMPSFCRDRRCPALASPERRVERRGTVRIERGEARGRRGTWEVTHRPARDPTVSRRGVRGELEMICR